VGRRRRQGKQLARNRGEGPSRCQGHEDPRVAINVVVVMGVGSVGHAAAAAAVAGTVTVIDMSLVLKPFPLDSYTSLWLPPLLEPPGRMCGCGRRLLL